MEKLNKACLILLIFALLGVIVVGSLYPFIQSKTGPTGPSGVPGQPGKSLIPVPGSISQQNVTQFTEETRSILQYENIVTFCASGVVNSVINNSTYIYGIISPIPSKAVSALCFFDDLNAINVRINTDGVMNMGPVVPASSYSFSFVYPL